MHKKTIYFSVSICMILFLNISFVASALTPQQEIDLRDKGLLTKEEIKIGNDKTGYRIFTPLQGKDGFVRIVADGVFAVNNMKVTTGEVLITTSGNKNEISLLVLKEGDY